jgi:hypothetical protein
VAVASINLDSMNKRLVLGDTVVFVAGRRRGQVGRYVAHGLDSGYLVPFVLVGGGSEDASREELSGLAEAVRAGRPPAAPPGASVERPWGHEVVSPRLLRLHRDTLSQTLRLADAMLSEAEAAMDRAADKENAPRDCPSGPDAA